MRGTRKGRVGVCVVVSAGGGGEAACNGGDVDRRCRRGDGLWFRSWCGGGSGAPPVCVFAAAHAKGVTLAPHPCAGRTASGRALATPSRSTATATATAAGAFGPSVRPHAVRACVVPMWASRRHSRRFPAKTPEYCGQHTYSGRALGRIYTDDDDADNRDDYDDDDAVYTGYTTGSLGTAPPP